MIEPQKLNVSLKQAISRINMLATQLDSLSSEIDGEFEAESILDRAGNQQRRIAKAKLAIATAPAALDYVQTTIEQLREFIDPTKKVK